MTHYAQLVHARLSGRGQYDADAVQGMSCTLIDAPKGDLVLSWGQHCGRGSRGKGRGVVGARVLGVGMRSETVYGRDQPAGCCQGVAAAARWDAVHVPCTQPHS